MYLFYLFHQEFHSRPYEHGNQGADFFITQVLFFKISVGKDMHSFIGPTKYLKYEAHSKYKALNVCVCVSVFLRMRGLACDNQSLSE